MNTTAALSAYRISGSDPIDLARFDPDAKPASTGDKNTDAALLADTVEAIGHLQDALYAEHAHGLLVVFQGMDTSGKDGVISSVFARVHPLGIKPVAFKAPTPEELSHDFLWRVHMRTPGLGMIGLFNRSHYEDVVTARVLGVIDSRECKRRFAHINDFERLLAETGVKVVKFFLHISRAEQKGRLERRLTDPVKHWKFDPQDLIERGRWEANMGAYQDAIAHTSTEAAPWWIVPADSKSHRNLMVALVVRKALEALAPTYPPLAPQYRGLKIED